MLILRRAKGETIVLGDGQIMITILETHKGYTRIGIDAPEQIPVFRGEIYSRRAQLQAKRNVEHHE